MKIAHRVLVFVLAACFAGLPALANAAGFAISTNGYADDAILPATDGYDKMSSDNVHSCGGTNHSPGFTWVNPPANTQSYAILEVDPDGAGGHGVNHWVIYNIPGSATGISSADIASAKFTPGRGSGDVAGYRAPCPPIGDAPHHYIVTLYALGVPPALPSGLDHDGVVAAIKDHILGATTTVFRFQRM
jgi:Raf kinase inhibitor-like YbhB/YbcL family protein